MKKNIVYLAACILLVLTMCSCQSKDPTNGKNPLPEDMVNTLIKNGKFPEMAELEFKTIQKYYSIDKDILESYSVFICASGAKADEIAIFKAKNLNQVSQLKEAVQKRAEAKTDDFKDYIPTEVPKIDDNMVTVKGRYVFFVINTNPKEAEQQFNSFFNED